MSADGDKIVQELQEFLELLERYRVKVENYTPRPRQAFAGGRTFDSELAPYTRRVVENSGRYKGIVQAIVGRRNMNSAVGSYDPWSEAFRELGSPIKLTSLTAVINDVTEAIGYLKGADIRSALPEILGTKKTDRPKIFLSHDGESPMRLSLQIKLWDLGLEPVVVEDRPETNRSIDDAVDQDMGLCTFAIVLARLERSSLQDCHHFPRASVVDEIARIRTIFGDKYIVLLENGLHLPPTQATGLTYKGFDAHNFDSAILNVIMALLHYGVI